MLTYLSPANQTGTDETDRQKTKYGYLVVEVLEANKTPISLASVMIYSEYKGELLMHKVLLTGINGKTEPVCFQIKNHGIMVCEGAPSDIPAKFTIRVEYNGFYTNIHKDAQIIVDTISVQTSYLMPLAFGTRNIPGQEKISEASLRPVTKL